MQQDMPGRRRRPGPVYDDAMRVLADDDLGAVLRLLGAEGTGAARRPADLPPHTVHPDLLVRLGTGELLHVEYVKDVTQDLDLRMLDYRSRLRRRDRDVGIRQVVLALGDVVVPDRYRDPDGTLTCRWSVVRTADIPPATLLRSPTTAALAALGHGSVRRRAASLADAADLIDAATDGARRDTLLNAAATLASIVLPRSTIVSTLQEVLMPVPVRETPWYQWLTEEGRQEGLQEGRREEALRFTTAALRRRFGADPRVDEIAARLVTLTDDERFDALAATASLDELQGPTAAGPS